MQKVKLLVAAAGLLALILQCGPGTADTSTAGKTAGVDIRGVVTDIIRAGPGGDVGKSVGTVMIVGVKEADSKYDKASVRVTGETAIFRQLERERAPATFADLQVGARVEARFEGPVAESYPVQATAAEIVILGSEQAAARASPTPAAAETAGAAHGAEDFVGTAGATERSRGASAPAVLREVRAAVHANFDRVVFEFEGVDVPGYSIEYVDRPVRRCGSGMPVPVAGDGWLLIRLVPARAHTEEGEATITEREREPGLTVLKELKLICDFEAEVSWVLGLSSPNRYRVLELKDPARLVVDVRH